MESSVRIVERWILAPLRDRVFISFDELNDAIAPLLAAMNERSFQKLSGSRRSATEEIDRPPLRPLPSSPYAYATWNSSPSPTTLTTDGIVRRPGARIAPIDNVCA